MARPRRFVCGYSKVALMGGLAIALSIFFRRNADHNRVHQEPGRFPVSAVVVESFLFKNEAVDPTRRSAERHGDGHEFGGQNRLLAKPRSRLSRIGISQRSHFDFILLVRASGSACQAHSKISRPPPRSEPRAGPELIECEDFHAASYRRAHRLLRSSPVRANKAE